MNVGMDDARKSLQRKVIIKAVSNAIVYAIYQVVRATFVWLGAMLADPAAFGLPEVTWLRALGLVLLVRPLITHVIGVHQQVDTAAVQNHAQAALFQMVQEMANGEGANDAGGK